MITLIDDLPPGTVGLRLSGTVSADDYRDVLEPAVTAAALTPGPLDVVVVVAAGLERFTLGAAVQDAAVGLRQRHEWGRIAVVSQHEHLNAAIGLFNAMARLDVRIFRLDQETEAIAWASHADG